MIGFITTLTVHNSRGCYYLLGPGSFDLIMEPVELRSATAVAPGSF